MQRGFANILIVLIVVIVTGVGGYLAYQRVNKSPSTPPPNEVACTQDAKLCSDGTSVGRGGPNCEFSPCPTTKETTDSADLSNWKTYSGKYFSFKYPSTWTTAQSVTGQSEVFGYSKVIEATTSRISPNAIIEVVYRSYSYEENIQQFNNRKSQKLPLDGREATRFQVDGGGHPLPSGYSIITIIAHGSDSTSYAITFNGNREEITDSLIDQILSTFRFLP